MQWVTAGITVLRLPGSIPGEVSDNLIFHRGISVYFYSV